MAGTGRAGLLHRESEQQLAGAEVRRGRAGRELDRHPVVADAEGGDLARGGADDVEEHSVGREFQVLRVRTGRSAAGDAAEEAEAAIRLDGEGADRIAH